MQPFFKVWGFRHANRALHPPQFRSARKDYFRRNRSGRRFSFASSAKLKFASHQTLQFIRKVQYVFPFWSPSPPWHPYSLLIPPSSLPSWFPVHLFSHLHQFAIASATTFPTPSLLYFASLTLHPQANPYPSTLHPENLNPQPLSLNPETLNPESRIPNPFN